MAVQCAHGQRQQLQVTGTLGITVGIRKKTPFRVLVRATELLHDGLVGPSSRVLAQLRRVGQRLAQLAKGPAFNQRERAQGLLAKHQLAQQAARRRATLDLVAAGPDLPRVAGQAKPGIQQLHGCIDTGAHHHLCHTLGTGSRVDRYVHRVRGHRQRLVQPPGRSATERGCQQDEKQQETSHRPVVRKCMKTPQPGCHTPGLGRDV